MYLERERERESSPGRYQKVLWYFCLQSSLWWRHSIFLQSERFLVHQVYKAPVVYRSKRRGICSVIIVKKQKKRSHIHLHYFQPHIKMLVSNKFGTLFSYPTNLELYFFLQNHNQTSQAHGFQKQQTKSLK